MIRQSAILVFISLLISSPLTAQMATSSLPTFSFLTAEQNAFVQSEVNRLTLKQKAGQMTQLAMDMLFEGDLYVLTKPAKWSEKKLAVAFDELEVGSILNYPSNNFPNKEQWHAYMQKLQGLAMEKTGVPIIYGIDAIHGPNYVLGTTLYAQPLGVAASFNEGLTEELASMTAYELKAASIPWNFSPAMDVGRNPVWPRTWESFGEDVYVNKTMGGAMVRGYQGDDAGANDKVAATLKHFTGYGAPFSGRDRTPVNLPERQLREMYFPQYQNAINLGALSIMINSGEVNGIPVHASKWLLTDILREEMGFEGLLVSDWEDVRFLHFRHKIAPTLKDAVRMAIEAGMDMSMTPVTTDFPKLVVELVEEGAISQERIDLSVARIIAVKVKLGLYEKNVWDPKEFDKFGGEEFAALSQRSAQEAIVLLKNEADQLPIKADQKILVTGPAANTMRSLNGGWTYSWQGHEADDYLKGFNTIAEALQKEFTGRIDFAQGIEIDKAADDMEQALKLAKNADVIVACMGESSYTEFLGNINDFNLPAIQYEYFEQLVATGKPVILIMAGGRPRIITQMAEKASAVLFAPYPGPRGGDALAGIMAGRVNPSGRLPLTYPREAHSLVFYDHKNAEEAQNGYSPLYEFGHGLSYTNFKYSDLSLSAPTLTEEGSMVVSVKVTNEGKMAGKHSVLLFSRDEYASITPSAKKLRKFTKVDLAAGASETVSFTITPEDLAFIGRDNKPVTEPGAFTLMVGDLTIGFTYE
ncbi:MAG: glycoside hydrolase family 3 N-terminal domain-containing protein [Bacteroidota bacterium]